MKKVVSFSGGRASAYLCKVMIEKFGRENVDFVFMDTGAKMTDTNSCSESCEVFNDDSLQVSIDFDKSQGVSEFDLADKYGEQRI